MQIRQSARKRTGDDNLVDKRAAPFSVELLHTALWAIEAIAIPEVQQWQPENRRHTKAVCPYLLILSTDLLFDTPVTILPARGGAFR